MDLYMPRLRVTFGGALAVNSDWQNTVEFILGSPIQNLATLQDIVQSCFANFGGTTSFTNALSPDSNLRTVKGIYYANNVPPASLVAESAGAPIVGAAAAQHAPQVCIVASLRTNQAGRSYRGRLYVPYRALRIESTGLVEPQGQQVAANFANGMKNTVLSACAAVGITASWVVWSPTLKVGTPITSILVGNQCDTQRRRNKNRDETYTSYPVTPADIQAQSQADQDRLESLSEQKIPLDFNLEVPDWAEDLANFAISVIPFVPPEAP